MRARHLTLPAHIRFSATQVRLSRSAWAFLALMGLHLLLTAYYFPPGEVLRDPPIANTDYVFHYYEAAAVAQILAADSRAWGYDPHLLAGYPVGAIFDVDNKGFALGVWLLGGLGLHPALAFNLLVMAVVLLAPVAGWAAARLLSPSADHAGPTAAVVAASFALLLWYLDPAFRWAWGGGTLAFAIVSLWAPVALSAFQRVLYAPSRRAWVLLALLTAALPLVHGLALLLLGLPLLIAYVAARRRLTWRQHSGLVAVALIALAVNAYWLAPLARFASIKVASDRFLQAFPIDLWRDLVGLGKTDVGLPRLYPVRWAAVGLLLLGWPGREQRRDLLPWVGGIAIWLALAYLGSLAPVVRDLEPYRFAMSAAALAAPPAAVILAGGGWRSPLGRPWRLRHVLAGALALGLAVQFWTVAQTLLPWQNWLSGRPLPVDLRLHGPPSAYRELTAWVRAHTDGDGGRILVNDWRLGTFLAAATGRQIIGGPHLWVWIQHGYANAGIWDLFGRDLKDYTPDELRQALQTYNVQWALTNADWAENSPFYTLDKALAAAPGLMERVTTVGGFHVYRATWPANDFLIGQGRVEADYNRLTVRQASPGGVVLKLHWLPTLRSDPPLPLASYPVLEDPVGFIRVDNDAVTDFTLYNAYVWPDHSR